MFAGLTGFMLTSVRKLSTGLLPSMLSFSPIRHLYSVKCWKTITFSGSSPLLKLVDEERLR